MATDREVVIGVPVGEARSAVGTLVQFYERACAGYEARIVELEGQIRMLSAALVKATEGQK